MLPGGDEAIVDREKLLGYVLNVDHAVGRNKARVFKAALGLTAASADVLESALRVAAGSEPASIVRDDAYGRHYAIEFALVVSNQTARVRSLWVIRVGETRPRFVSAFVL